MPELRPGTELSAGASAGKIPAGPVSVSPLPTPSIGMPASGTWSLENGAMLSENIGSLGGTVQSK